MASYEVVICILTFCCLLAASLGALLLYSRLPERYQHEETVAIIRLIGNVFIVMTSLVLGLMINSARNTFDGVDHNAHVIATDMILLDRTLRRYGPEADDMRARLLAYVRHARDSTRPKSDPLIMGDPLSEQLLTATGDDLKTLKPADTEQTNLAQDAHTIYQAIYELRWELVEQAEGTLPLPLLVMLVAWLMLVFASLGYRAPNNRVVVCSLVLAAALIAGTVYLILDMDGPFSGLIQVSDAPLDRVIAELTR
ncbi:hypothetical protein GCM10007874_09680 [Labrys miyagiensis]|uniref:DUF4239 domain-containing protein n=1 Tax=Labrys miyagiensis TaxID=346912 RepID=A0ABQ6CI28_9HYPH|nr:DUF4239 domain-containing protein [Labrys miyagiensis]GLS17952.1 hypothetical protein GCM10007874_09680 [Labrys miyagiensis]